MKIPEIGLVELAISLAPILVVLIIFMRWSLPVKELLVATIRMVIQLLAIGFALIYLFKQDDWWLGVLLISVMLIISAWIALRPLADKSRQHLGQLVLSLSIGCGLILSLLLVWVLKLEPWYQPRFVIPLAGLLLANIMNCLSLAGERLDSELKLEQPIEQATKNAFNTAMIPKINSLLAVGLVALPGTMTGQILSGVSPEIAVRYQIVIMASILCSAAFAVAIYLSLRAKSEEKSEKQAEQKKAPTD